MSKSGRYSADRKNIESVTGTTKVIEVSECGTIFFMDTAAAACTYTLPRADLAGPGWWCKFVQGVDHNDADHVIQINSEDVGAFGTDVHNLHYTAPSAGAHPDATTGSASTAMRKVTLQGSATEIGDQLEVVCDGTRWFMTALHSGSAIVSELT